MVTLIPPGNRQAPTSHSRIVADRAPGLNKVAQSFQRMNSSEIEKRSWLRRLLADEIVADDLVRKQPV